ncbi:hypothetical protein ACFL6U_18860 [Planctomycetota bacterium]
MRTSSVETMLRIITCLCRGFGCLGLLMWPFGGSVQAGAEPQETPIQQIRVALERHEQDLRLLRLDYQSFQLLPDDDGQIYAQLREKGTWIHKNFHQYLHVRDASPSQAPQERFFLKYDQGPLYLFHRDSPDVQIIPLSERPPILPADLGLRLRSRRLSQFMKPEWATVDSRVYRLHGRDAWLVKVHTPDSQGYRKPFQVWIDQQRGVPLRIATYQVSTHRGAKHQLKHIIDDIQYVPLPQGGWVPVQAEIRYDPEESLRHFRIVVEPNSVQTKSEAIPDSLMELPKSGVAVMKQSLPQIARSFLASENNLPLESLNPEDIWYTPRGPDERAVLTYLRNLAHLSEAALAQIQFRWSVVVSTASHERESNRENPQPLEANRRGQLYSRIRGAYACLNSQHHCQLDRDTLATRSRWSQGSVYQWDDEILMLADRPNCLTGVIDRTDQFPWTVVAPITWIMKPGNGSYFLSEFLVPEFAYVHDTIQMLRGWETYVVDARHPHTHRQYLRLWLDVESGMPLQIDTYEIVSPGRLERVERVTEVELQASGAGGWLPIRAQRIQYRHAEQPFERTSTMGVYLHSLSTDVNDFTLDLFLPPFKSGARVYNALTDTWALFEPEEGFRPALLRSKSVTRPTSSGPGDHDPNQTKPVIPDSPNSPPPVDAHQNDQNTPLIDIPEEDFPESEVSTNLDAANPTHMNAPAQNQRRPILRCVLVIFIPLLGLVAFGCVWRPIYHRFFC